MVFNEAEGKMASDSYSYYYHQQQQQPQLQGSTATNYNAQPSLANWNDWTKEQLSQYTSQNYNGNMAAYHAHSMNNHSLHRSNNSLSRSQPYPSNYMSNRMYYRNSNFSNNSAPLPYWQRNQNGYKRGRPEVTDSSEPQLKTSKKRKKPLSQNIPSKKEWTLDEAKSALDIEKEFNKKCNALIIKFPDHELSKDIVGSYHTAIENVHFQQPSAPRFCFVTLKNDADPEEVISTLNKQKFGDGYLSVEYKKDREEDQKRSKSEPGDLDPLTLYVGNLAQEVTKEDIVNLYPISKRIDIGFAKKMKYTRYAFVSFRNAGDALDAFKKTHSKLLHNKSLIVRFRRLHGTNGMPGESKPQNPPKSRDATVTSNSKAKSAPVAGETSQVPAANGSAASETTTPSAISPPEVSPSALPKPALSPPPLSPPPLSPLALSPLAVTPPALCSPDHSPTITSTPPMSPSLNAPHIDNESMGMLQCLKQEHIANDSDEEFEQKPSVSRLTTPYSASSMADKRPSEEGPIIKVEPESSTSMDKNYRMNKTRIKSEMESEMLNIKSEPFDSDDEEWNDLCYNEEEANSTANNQQTTDFDGMYESMVNHARQVLNLKRPGPAAHKN